MRKIKLGIFIGLIACFFGCETKKTPNILFVNADSSVTIRCHGERKIMFDPWVLVVEPIYKDSVREPMVTEVYLDDFTKENISVLWTEQKVAMIKVIERDGEEKVIPVAINF